MNELPWMLLRVALETAAHHRQADDDRLAAMEVATADAYRAFLVRVYGVEVPVEEAVWRTKGLHASLLRDREKAGLLRADLVALGMSARELAAIPLAPVQIRSAEQALGWMFVLERQTLLAGLIRRHLLRAVGDAIAGATGYLGAYGDTPGARFRAFGEGLCRHTEWCRPTAITAGANEAFRAQRQWYRAREGRSDASASQSFAW